MTTGPTVGKLRPATVGRQVAPDSAAAGRVVPRILAVVVPPLLYLAYALYLCWPTLAHPGTRLFARVNGSDEVAAQWFLAHAAYSVAHLRDPFSTDLLNVPAGVNLAAQASLVGVGIPLTPVTLLFGAEVSYQVLLVASLAGTATAWYWLFAAKLRLHVLAAGVAAALCGFNEHLVAQNWGRNHVTFQVLVPVIIWHVTRLSEPDHPVRRAVVLGLLIAWQALIGEEVLLFTAIGLLVFAIGYVAARPAILGRAGAYARGLALAGAVALVVLAYPLWLQFFGAGRFRGFPIDLQSYLSPVSVYTGLPAGWTGWLPGHRPGTEWLAVTGDPAIGLPLLLLLMVGVVWLRRRATVLATVAVLLVFVILSFGSAARIGTHLVPQPWRLVNRLPVFEAVEPDRLTLGAVVAAAVLLALILDALLRGRRPWPAERAAASLGATGRHSAPISVTAARWSWSRSGALALAVVAVLLAAIQLRPAQPEVWEPAPLPNLVNSGVWRAYTANGRTLMSVPPANSFWTDGQRWSTAAHLGFGIPQGYFIGPESGGEQARWGAPPNWTAQYLDQTIATGQPPAAVPGDRDRFVADLRHWRVGALVLIPQQVHWEALRNAVARFLGAPQWVGGAWLWDVRALT